MLICPVSVLWQLSEGIPQCPLSRAPGHSDLRLSCADSLCICPTAAESGICCVNCTLPAPLAAPAAQHWGAKGRGWIWGKDGNPGTAPGRNHSSTESECANKAAFQLPSFRFNQLSHGFHFVC